MWSSLRFCFEIMLGWSVWVSPSLFNTYYSSLHHAHIIIARERSYELNTHTHMSSIIEWCDRSGFCWCEKSQSQSFSKLRARPEKSAHSLTRDLLSKGSRGQRCRLRGSVAVVVHEPDTCSPAPQLPHLPHPPPLPAPHHPYLPRLPSPQNPLFRASDWPGS